MDYRDTVFLPNTTMPTRNKAQHDLPILNKWSTLYQDVMARNIHGDDFNLHDGPPYANGGIHIGHAMNKILKDFVIRSRNLLGYRAEFRPGWDCHGLPIEWKVEEEWRKAKRDKNDDPKAFRQDCRDYAQRWVDHQMEQFKRLGVMADWANPYLTMSPDSEMKIMGAFHDLVAAGRVFRDNRPTLWSPIEKTSLSDAEVVEREHDIPNIWVSFRLTTGPLTGTSLLVWTTTPWSLVGNTAVAFNPNIQYGLFDTPQGRFIVANDLSDTLTDGEYIRDIANDEILNATYVHPLGDQFPNGVVIAADFVRANSGTGLVHVGPAHSIEDWTAWRKAGYTDYPNSIKPNGQYQDDVPFFGGMSVTKGKKFGPAQDAVLDKLTELNTLYGREDRKLTISHSWRSDAILLTISSPQWFIDLEETRQDALDALAGIKVTPYSAKVRMHNMAETRPNWLVSRQRLWGTPLGLFINHQGEPCRDSRVLIQTYNILSQRGTEAWFDLTVREVFEAAGRKDWDDWTRQDDVLDVWFDSSQVSNILGHQADLVIEGTDQARGWFGSSLWASALANVPAQKEILTHGFVLDKNGRKMSKSEGNVIDPMKVVDQYGADALRIWVSSIDWTSDVKVSDESLRNSAEIARKLRNSLRYLSGALHGYLEPNGPVILPESEAFVMEKTYDLDRGENSLTRLLENHSYTGYLNKLMDYCQFISSHWFDVRKDVLYCDAEDSETRIAYRWALNRVYDYLVRWLAPLMPFAAEESWESLGRSGSVHTQRWMKVSDDRDELLVERWETFCEMRPRIMEEIERQKSLGTIKNASEAVVMITTVSELPHEIATLLMVSQVDVQYGDEISVTVMKSELQKCQRCWQHVITNDSELCERCHDVVN